MGTPHEPGPDQIVAPTGIESTEAVLDLEPIEEIDLPEGDVEQ
jgi:hypothetical protein